MTSADLTSDDPTVTPIANQRVGEFTDAVASDAPTPGGGAVVGTVAALAAALVGMAGRYSALHQPDSPVFADLVDTSDRLRARAAALADADADAYGRYVRATHSTVDPVARRVAIRAALDAAATVPLELCLVAAEVADAAEQLAVTGNPRLRTDACTAALLASAVASSTALLVAANLHGSPEDPRIGQAAVHARAARDSADRALAVDGSLDLRERVLT